jgi:hypothetical protein
MVSILAVVLCAPAPGRWDVARIAERALPAS